MDAPLNIKQALAVAIGAACSMSASATNLDYFSGTMSATTMPDAGAPTELSRTIDQNIAVTDPGLASTIIGDTRQIILSRSSNNGQAITANITPRTPGDSNHSLSFDFTDAATATVIWNDGGNDLNVDLSAASTGRDGFILSIEEIARSGNANAPMLTMRLSTTGGGSSVANVTLPGAIADGAVPNSSNVRIPYGLFSSGADFSDIDQIELIIESSGSGGATTRVSLDYLRSEELLNSFVRDLTLDNDADADGNISPGDTVGYRTQVSSDVDASGNSISGFRYHTVLPRYASIVPGSISVDSIITGNPLPGFTVVADGSSNGVISVDLPPISPTEAQVINYQAVIENPLRDNIDIMSSRFYLNQSGRHQIGIHLAGQTGVYNLDTALDHNESAAYIYSEVDGSSGMGARDLPLAGIDVELWHDVDGSSSLDGGDQLLDTRTTNSSGRVDFYSGNMGDYLFRVVPGQARLQGATAWGGHNGVAAYTIAANAVHISRLGYILPDADSDGINSNTEEGVDFPGGSIGDGNDDGTPDAEQVSVSSLQTSNGDWITLESVDGHSLSSVASQYPVAGPSGYAFPYGTISFSAAVGSGGTGNATEFRILVPRNDNIVGYWKRDIDGVLVDVNTVAGSNLNIDHSSFAGRTEITFSITEGSRIDTDSDPETITDPGGPVVIASAASAGQVAVPALPLGFLLAMPLALLGLAGWRRKG